jgi:ATP-dependent exoDNAse (exonuclease V) beta subunit
MIADTPAELEHLKPIADALSLLKSLHRRRNYRPVSATLHQLLGETRAHVGFALRTGGEQALANVLHVAELARQFEMGGGISFRGFVDELRLAAENAQAAEAPILEEDSDGVRMMTVHKAKGLEFPVVILADMTCRLSRQEAGRWIDAASGVCALKLGGWAPIDLVLHDAEESARDRAEGERLAYVAATRARDLLVVPTIGDEVYDGGWLDPLMPAVYPPVADRRRPSPTVGCAEFKSRDSVVTRPDDDPAKADTVAPGTYRFASVSAGGPSSEIASGYSVVWWDPHQLALGSTPPAGLRRDDLISKDGDPKGVEARLAAFRDWESQRATTIARARVPSLRIARATDLARASNVTTLLGTAPEIEIVDVPKPAGRPFGPAFGSLVHAVLATAPLTADPDLVHTTARTQARVLVASEQDAAAAADAVIAVLRHPLFDRARASAVQGRCSREVPVLWVAPDGTLVEGTVDLAFRDENGLTIVDFKTDRDPFDDVEPYRNQLGLYARALANSDEPTSLVLVRL